MFTSRTVTSAPKPTAIFAALMPTTPPPMIVTYAETAREFGLAASRGSDFHSPGESNTDLGQLPFLPGQLAPVWEMLADRIR
jgi:hypothetical protein